jgi:hypothetical protein
MLGIGARERRRSIGVNRPEYVFVGEEMSEVQVLNCSPEIADSGGISSKFDLGVGDADIHEAQPFTSASPPHPAEAQAKEALVEVGDQSLMSSLPPQQVAGDPSRSGAVESPDS